MFFFCGRRLYPGQKNQLQNENEELKQQKEELKQQKEELEVRVNALMSQYEGRFSRQERELRDLREQHERHGEQRDEPAEQGSSKVTSWSFNSKHTA